MDAWETLVGNSSAIAGSDAWVHLNNQESGGNTYLTGGVDVSIERVDTAETIEIEAATFDIEMETHEGQIETEIYEVSLSADIQEITLESNDD